MGRQTSHRSNCFLPSLPELHSLGLVARHFYVPRSAVKTDSSHGLEICRDAGFEPIELDEENRLGVPRIAGSINRVFHDSNGRAIHELQRSRNDSRRDDRGCDMRCRIHRHKIGEERPHGLRLWRELYRYFEREPETSLRSDESSAEIVSVALADLAPQLDDLTARQNDRHCQDMIERDAVLETVRTASVFCDVATDRARSFARGIRSVKQTMRRDVFVEPKIHDAWLDGGAAVFDVERDDLLESMQPDNNDVVGESSSRQPRSGTARHKREALLGKKSNDGDSFFTASRKNRKLRLAAVPGQPVGVVNQ